MITFEKEKRISIIMPIYNCENYLHDSIRSVLGQSFQDFELLLIDDGSKDHSFDICMHYAEEDERLRAEHIENRGVSGARNYGLSLAEAEYIFFMDADDMLPEQSLQRMYESAQKTHADLVIGAFDANREFFQSELRGIKTKQELIHDFIPNLPSFYYGVPWNKLYRKKLIEANQISFNENLAWCEDFLFNVKYYGVCSRIYYLQEAVYFYVLRGTGLAGMAGKKNSEFIFQIDLLRFQETCKLLHGSQENEQEKEYLYDFMASAFHAALRNICSVPVTSGEKRFDKFNNMFALPEVTKLFSEYENIHHYRASKCLKKFVIKKQIKRAYFHYMIREKMKKISLIRKIAQKVTFSPSFRW